LLLKLSRIAIESGFPTPSKKPNDPEFDAESHLRPLIDQAGNVALIDSDERLLGLDIVGHGGGQWQLVVRGDDLISVETGLHIDRTATCRVDIGTYAELVSGRTTWQQAFLTKSAELSGNGRSAAAYATILEQLASLSVK
jgi:hypothetical protein